MPKFVRPNLGHSKLTGSEPSLNNVYDFILADLIGLIWRLHLLPLRTSPLIALVAFKGNFVLLMISGGIVG